MARSRVCPILRCFVLPTIGSKISVFFVILTTFQIPICISVGWSCMICYGKEYITTFLIREFMTIAMFFKLDLLLLYVLPKSVQIPMLCRASIFYSLE
uniref:NADH-ubiquinone oxidoreductase chain 4 n=1 Tax=Solanum lycopersicum TaxID=4081 RepID=K4CZT9_SOLLC